MTIKFVCSCGKRMSARDDMAGRRSFCPRCGEPVGIPGRTATHPDGSPGPLSPQERRRQSANRAAVDAAALTGPVPPIPPPPDPLTAVTPVLPPGVRLPEGGPRKLRPALRPRRTWNLERHWAECLAYPLRAYALLLALGTLLALDGIVVVAVLPTIQEGLRESFSAWAAPLAAVLLPSLILIAYVCAFLDGALASGAAGVAGIVPWPGRDFGLIVWCFVA